MVFKGFAANSLSETSLPRQKPLQTLGLPRSFLVNQYYPLYSHFFTALGFQPVLSDGVEAEGIKRKRSSFCFPAEIAHGVFQNLLDKKPDYIFLPILTGVPVEGGGEPRQWYQATCLLLQSEVYYLRSAFQGLFDPRKLLSPMVNFTFGLSSQADVFVTMAVKELGAKKDKAILAFKEAVNVQNSFAAELRLQGARMLEELEAHPGEMAVVLFGRSYNAFAREANLGIPGKFASRGIRVIPWDALDFEGVDQDPDLNWGVGQNFLRAARLVEKHPQLFGTFVTNFSCGPDSFLVGYFRDIMKSKPSLTLELDSHSADAGVNTRIEAFLDVVEKFRKVREITERPEPFRPSIIEIVDKKGVFVNSRGERSSLYDSKSHLLFPSMGPLGTDFMAAVFRGLGIRATGLPVPNYETLKAGRGNTACKECLPLILCAGGLLEYLRTREKDDENVSYFMPTSGGGCRLGQYNVFLRKMIERKRIPDVAVLSLTNANGYAGFASKDVLNVLRGVIVSDVLEDIDCALKVLAVDPKGAKELFDAEVVNLLKVFTEKGGEGLYSELESAALRLKKIPLNRPLAEAVKVGVHGEIFVRRDHFSTRDVVARLQERGFVVKKAHVFEWLAYCDHNVDQGHYPSDQNWKKWLTFQAKMFLQNSYERKIKKSLAKSGLYDYELLYMKEMVRIASHFFDPRSTGEALLGTGAFFHEILHSLHGVVQVGPFACMPTRVGEAVLTPIANQQMREKLVRNIPVQQQAIQSLPYLVIETDGNPLPQILDSRLEAFCLQVERVHQKLGGNLQG